VPHCAPCAWRAGGVSPPVRDARGGSQPGANAPGSPIAPVRLLAVLVASAILSQSLAIVRAGADIHEQIAETQAKVVKIYGAGGLRALEAYQTGFLISAEGHVLTAWSHVLDSAVVTVTLDDGRRFESKLVGADSELELAVLKFDGSDLPHFDLSSLAAAEAGTRVLAYSNLFGVAAGNEPVSVQRGVVAARIPLSARRGIFESRFQGPVYILDAVTNNPGAAGGPVTNLAGELIAMLGKELKSAESNLWLNYAMPIDPLAPAVTRILAGAAEPLTAQTPTSKSSDGLDPRDLGIVLVPDVVQRTPAYVDEVRPNSPAARAGLLRGDLILFVDGQLVPSVKVLCELLAKAEHAASFKLTVLRDGNTVELTVQTPPLPSAERAG